MVFSGHQASRADRRVVSPGGHDGKATYQADNASLLRRPSLAAPAAAQGVPRLDSYDGVAVRILQSNNAGNIHHIIDPSINRVVGVIKGCPHAHNLTVHPDGLYYYCANEQDKTIDVFDTKTLQLVQQIQLSERPNKIAVNKKYRKIYAAIVSRTAKVAGPDFKPRDGSSLPAVVDVIDIATHKVIRSVAVHHPVHNMFVTPDENQVVAGLRGEVEPGEPTFEVIDPKTDTVVWGMELTGHRHTAGTLTKSGQWPSKPAPTVRRSARSRKRPGSTPCG